MENRDHDKHRADDYEERRNRRPFRTDEQDHTTPPGPETEGLADLDRDGMIGHTGGFYGGTSYVGSNYGEDWNADTEGGSRHEGNYGAAGQQDSSVDRSEREERTDCDGERNPAHLTKDDSII